ncbi:MAG TPA: CDP-archaeol synthase [Ktedonobacteraceae bacterium]|nr:CDP-archaeol synthase [Ktedonobacteraceae bacterium]
MLRDIFFVIWFFLPAGLGNAAPIIAAKVPVLKSWSYPLDGYVTFHGKRLFGDHKTVRGLVSGTFTGMLTASLQVVLYNEVSIVREAISLDYSQINPLLFGALAAFGALTGDALKSFFKRQCNIAPGASWFPFDQIDYVIGGIVFTAFYIRLSLPQYLLLFLIWTVLHPIATFVGYTLKLKAHPI